MQTYSRYLFTITGLFLLAFVLYDRLQLISSEDFITSVDSYYYLIEYKSFLENKELYYGTNKIFFFSLGKFGEILGFNEFALYRFTAILSLFCFAFAAGFYLFLSKRYFLIAITTACFLTSQNWFYLVYNFPRQALSMSLLGLSAVLFSKYRLPAVIIAIFAALTHIFSLAILVCFFAVLIICKSNSYLHKISILFAFILLITGLGSLLGKSFIDLSRNPFQLSWLTAIHFHSSNAHLVEFSLQTVTWLALMYIVLRSGTKDIAVWLLCFLWFIFNIPIWDIKSHMLGRLAFTSVWFLLLSIVLAIGKNIINERTFVTLLTIAAIGAYSFGEPFKTPDRNLDIQLKKHANALNSWLPENAVIIAQHGVVYRIVYYLDRESYTKLPNVNLNDQDIFYLKLNTENRSDCQELDANNQLSKDIKCVIINKSWILG